MIADLDRVDGKGHWSAMATRLTRAELYALVWDRPMTKLAKEFALSDVALHKICRKNNVPTPPQGHWAKKAYNKQLKITPLPVNKSAGPASAEIVIYEGAATSETEAMSDVRARTQSAIDSQTKSGSYEPSKSIDRTVARIGKARANSLGLVETGGKGLITSLVRSESAERVRQILEQFERTASEADIELVNLEGGTAWAAEGEHVGFEIVELADRYEHVPTDKELKAVAKWEAEREATHKRYGYWSDYGRPRIPKWESRYEGRLGIRLEEVRMRVQSEYGGPTIHRSFCDTKTRDIFKQIPKAVSTIAAIAVAKRENRTADERRRIAAQEAARQRAEQARLAEIEKRQGEILGELISERGEAEKLEFFAAYLARCGMGPSTPRLLEFHQWLRDRIEKSKKSSAAASLEERLE